MSDYTDSPQAQLGIGCLICGRPLAAADSLALHMGPICRKRVGAPELSLDADQLHEANVMTGLIAREGATQKRLELLRGISPDLACLADRLALIRAPVSIWNDGAKLRIEFRYSDRAVNEFRSIPGRRFHPSEETGIGPHWTAPLDSRPAVWAWLRSCFPGELIAVTKGAEPVALHEVPQ